MTWLTIYLLHFSTPDYNTHIHLINHLSTLLYTFSTTIVDNLWKTWVKPMILFLCNLSVKCIWVLVICHTVYNLATSILGVIVHTFTSAFTSICLNNSIHFSACWYVLKLIYLYFKSSGKEYIIVVFIIISGEDCRWIVLLKWTLLPLLVK